MGQKSIKEKIYKKKETQVKRKKELRME